MPYEKEEGMYIDELERREIHQIGKNLLYKKKIHRESGEGKVVGKHGTVMQNMSSMGDKRIAGVPIGGHATK